jgi:hypothetical protein
MRLRLHTVGYLLAWAGIALYLWRFVDRGWIPHDDGMLAHIAERILAGQMPHRDFDDPYTGGLGYLHALAFLAFGVHLLSLRILLFLAALAWIPAVFAVARRFVSPLGSALVTATAVAWTLPSYFASMPSYYNLFFATWGTAALLRHLDTNSRVWLFIAGLCGGLSFLIKLSGVYFIGAAVLFLLYREQLRSRGREKSSAALVGKTGVGLIVVTGLAGLALTRPGASEVLHFFAPGTALVAVLLWTEWRDGHGAAGERVRGATFLILPFLAGALLPVSLFLTPYIASNAVGAWYEGVFVLPRSRFDAATTALPPLITMVAAVPYGAVLVAGVTGWHLLDRRHVQILLAATSIVVGILMVLGGAVDPVHRAVWYSVRHLTIPVVLAGCLLVASGKTGLSMSARQELYLLLLLAAFMPLVQIPFAAAIYFCYAAPFLLLAALAVIRNSSTRIHWVHPVLLAGYLFFALLWTNSNYVWTLGTYHEPYNFVGAPGLRRAGITMTPADRAEYTKLIGLIQLANASNRQIYAGPDCPEVYFLSGTSNATRMVYEFLRPAMDTSETLAELERQRVDVVVINRSPGFSRPLDADLARAFEQRYPYSAEAGRFVVRWRL